MSSVQVQETRKAQNIQAAAQAVRETKPDTFRLDEALGELLIGDDHKVVAIVVELAETVARQDRAITHLVDHVIAGQDKKIERLQERVEKPKSGSGATKK